VIDLARAALEAAGDDPVVLINTSYPLAYFGENIRDMMALADRAMSLNSSYARGWYVSAILRVIAGESDLAIEHIERSVGLSPRDSVGVPTAIMGLAQFLTRRFEPAAQNFRLTARQVPGWPSSYRMLTACYAHMGRLDEAREAIEQMRAIGVPLAIARVG
jgi:adenylate cyclase